MPSPSGPGPSSKQPVGLPDHNLDASSTAYCSSKTVSRTSNAVDDPGRRMSSASRPSDRQPHTFWQPPARSAAVRFARPPPSHLSAPPSSPAPSPPISSAQDFSDHVAATNSVEACPTPTPAAPAAPALSPAGTDTRLSLSAQSFAWSPNSTAAGPTAAVATEASPLSVTPIPPSRSPPSARRPHPWLGYATAAEGALDFNPFRPGMDGVLWRPLSPSSSHNGDETFQASGDGVASPPEDGETAVSELKSVDRASARSEERAAVALALAEVDHWRPSTSSAKVVLEPPPPSPPPQSPPPADDDSSVAASSQRLSRPFASLEPSPMESSLSASIPSSSAARLSDSTLLNPPSTAGSAQPPAARPALSLSPAPPTAPSATPVLNQPRAPLFRQRSSLAPLFHNSYIEPSAPLSSDPAYYAGYYAAPQVEDVGPHDDVRAALVRALSLDAMLGGEPSSSREAPHARNEPDPVVVHPAWVDLLSPLGAAPANDHLLEAGRPLSNQDGRYALLPPSKAGSAGWDAREWDTDTGDPAAASRPEQTRMSTPVIKGLDAYADIYVPRHLTDLQSSIPDYLHLPDPLAPFPTADYPATFFPPYLDPPPALSSTLLSRPPPNPNTPLPTLTAASYTSHWLALLALELAALAARSRSIVLWKLSVEAADDVGTVRALVPGVREEWPRVRIGDACLMRGLRPEGEAFVGRVTAMSKREGLIYVHVPLLLERLFPPSFRHGTSFYPRMRKGQTLPGHFNLVFQPSPTPTLAQAAAVAHIGRDLESACAIQGEGHKCPAHLEGSETDLLVRRWLFPVEDDMLGRPAEVSGLTRELDWVDGSLNEEQQAAVRAVAMHRSPVPFLVSGPFGTGKTKTVVELTLQILRHQPSSTILLVGPSNSATDTLCLRLRGALGARGDMLRLNDRERTFAEVPDAILPFCFTEGTHFAVPPFAQLMKYRVVLTSTADAVILLRARVSNRDLGALEACLVSSIHPSSAVAQEIEPHWTHLLVDEAGQASEPDILVPIAVVLPHERTSPVKEPQLVLCGDGQQLGPIVSSDAARNGELDVSLLERLFERPLYAPPSSVEIWRPFVKLVKNYRCHPALLMTPSALFYGDSLQPHARNGVVRWARLPNEDLPLLVLHTVGVDCSIDEGASWFNTSEINEVVAAVRSLLDPVDAGQSSPPVQISDIGVMSAFREQVWRIRERLRAEGFGAVDVGSVEDYQGREKRITIVSTVRSRARFLGQDSKKSLGLVFEQKRFNVSITRAKEALIIVGNAEILARDPYWRGLLHFALRHELLVGPELELQAGNDYMSALESEYLAFVEERRVAEGDGYGDEARGLRLSGALAREVLRDVS